jgi:hypothetical protein
MPQNDREKLSEREIADLPDDEKKKFIRVVNSLEDLANAEARHESQKKMRILFERAPPETLPFIVYVVYVTAIAVGSIVEILYLEGIKLYIGVALLVVIMILPLTLLEHKSWKNFVEFVKKRLSIRNEQ